MAIWHRRSRSTTAGITRKVRRSARKQDQQVEFLRRPQIEQFEPRQMLAVSPQLISIIPSAGDVLNLNGTEVRNQEFRELTFRFDEGQRIDETSVRAGGIQIIRAGGDGVFGNGNDVNVTPNIVAKNGFIGLGDRPNEVVVRFSDHLPDDLYQIRVVGAGPTPLLNVEMQPFNNGVDRTVRFELDLGPQITAVVPQPIRRVGGQLQQARNEIEVYFNNDDLNQTAATNPAFYQLIRTRTTANNLDDGPPLLPTSVVYDPAADMVRLIFASDLATLDNTETVYRLRIGNQYTSPLAPLVRAVGDAGDTFLSANTNGSQQISAPDLSTRPVILQGQIKQVTPYGIELPGSNDEPGHRDIPARDYPLTEVRRGVDTPHVEETDTHDGIETIYYSFKTIYGADPLGNSLTNLMSPTQKQRAREAFAYYAQYLGVQFVEVQEGFATAPTDGELYVVALGDLRAVDPTINSGPGGALVLASRERNLAVVDNAENWGANEPGGGYFRAVMQGIGELLGMGHAFDLPPTTIMGDTHLTTPDAAFPGDADIVHGQYTHRPESTDIDVYRFTLNQAGVFSAEVAAERLVHSSLLDSVLWVYSSSGELIARNDDYYSEDSYVELLLQPGDYYVAVTSTGMNEIDPAISESGFGGTTEGDYELRLNFRPSPERTPTAASGLVDIDGQPTLLDGDTDGTPGGEYNFWFTVAPAANTLIVDKSAPTGGTGTLASPMNNIQTALAAATARNSDGNLTNDVRVVRIVGNGGADGNLATLADNLAYEIGFNSLGQVLADGSELQVPKGVTVMVDAGAIFKLRRANIDVGSRSQNVDRSLGHLQILGTPTQSVYFTSYHNETLGRDTFALPTTPAAGDWGGIVFHNELDYDAGRTVLENEGIFINYVNHANLGYGGGDVSMSGVQGSFSPIQLNEARPSISFNTITNSAGAAMAADPNSFRDNLVNDVGRTGARFRADYSRIGPEIYFNRLADNTINGLFIAIETQAGQVLDRLEVAARFNDTDIAHVLSENLIIQGTPGGAVIRPGIAAPASQPTFSQGTVSITAGVVTLTGGTWPAWVRSETLLTVGTATFTVAARNSDTELRLTNSMAATTGNRSFVLVGRPSLQDARLRIDPGIIVKVDSARIETEIGAQLIAEGLPNNRVVFTSLLDDRFGGSGTFDTAGRNLGPFSQGTISALNGVVTLVGGIWPSWAAGATLTVNNIEYTVLSRDSDTQITLTRNNVNFAGAAFTLTKVFEAAPGDWGGLYFGPISSGSVDHALITYGGGTTAVEGGFGGFNAVEIQQAEVRLTNSVLETNDDGSQGGRNSQRFSNDDTTIYVRGAQPVIVGNTIRDNTGAAISASANSLNSNLVQDWGRSTGALSRTGDFVGNFGPVVRNNRLAGNGVNGMVVRGATLTTQSVWDDVDIVHVVDGEVIVPNYHTYGGLRLQSSGTSSLVVKMRGLASGITASGSPLDIDDRIGGSVQILGTPGHPVVVTTALDSTVGAGLDPQGNPQNETIAGAKPPASTTSQLNVEYRMSTQNATNAAFVAALNLAASFWESALDDPISVVLDVSFAALAGPAALATPLVETRPYDQVRQLMIDDADPTSEAIVRQLPTFAQLQTQLPDQTYVVSPTMELTRANLLALGVDPSQLISRPSTFDPLTLIDGTLQFDTGVTFDFDPSDGITPGAVDFVAVAAHEIGHALGFFSAVDDVDAGIKNIDLFPLDLFRLAPGAGATDFTNSSRVLDPAAPNHVFYDGGIYNDPIVTVLPLTVGDIPLSRGVSSDGFQASHWKDESQLPAGAPEIGIMDPQIIFGVRNRISPNDSRAFDLIGYDAVSRGTPGDWRSIRLDALSNDRNAAVVTEAESVAGTNDSSSSAQMTGELAPDERSGDENRRLAFEIHGALASNGDVDVYSFVGRAGTEVWLDIDRTSPALDSVLELIDAAGNVLARSNDSVLRDQSSPGNQVHVEPLQRDIYEGRDLYGTNRHDAGLRLFLPGPAGTQQTYYVRVRSNVRAGDSLDDASKLHSGQSRGGYQLQVRLRELDEIPGSTIQYADIRYAQNGIEILGMPGHSPLLGESGETTANNDTRANAQNLGNVLTVDRGAISVAGSLTDYNDVDWYQFVVDWDKIDDYPDGTGIRHDDFASVIFDVDFASGAGRPDTTLALYDANGTLLYISRNSGISDDQVAPGLTSDLGDLTRGSFGPNDPFLGPVSLRENAGMTYYLAVMSDAVLPDALKNNPLTRIEPLLAQDRLIDDRVGGSSWFPVYANELRDTPGLFFNPVQTAGDAWQLGDVSLFVHDGARLYSVDPYTGAMDADYGPRRGFANAGYGDIGMRTDGRLIGMAVGGQGGQRGSTVEIAIGTNTETTVGDDGIQGDPIYDAFTVEDAGNDNRIIYAISNDSPGRFFAFNANSGTTDNQLTGFDNDPGKTLGIIDTTQPPPGTITYMPFTEHVTGLARVQGTFYAVTDEGTLISIRPNGRPENPPPDPLPNPPIEWAEVTVIATLMKPDPLDRTKMIPIPFSGLTRGPENVEGRAYARTLFATDSDGDIHAFDTKGVLQNVFAGGVTSVSTRLAGLTGLAFSSLDYNLWHVTDRRGQDDGRGTYPTPDGVRGGVHILGGNGWHFGLEQDKGQLEWPNYNTNPTLFNTYDLPGGSHGKLTTEPFSLTGQSFRDSPTLYFNYFSQHDSDATDTPDNSALDSFRVYASADGANWTLLSQTPVPMRFVPVAVRTNMFNDTGVWRQAYVDLSDFAGLDNVRVRFDFNTSSSNDVGLPQLGGEVLGIKSAAELNDGDSFVLNNVLAGVTTFEFDTGFNLVVPGAGGHAIVDGETFALDDGSGPVTFEFDTAGDDVAAGNIAIAINPIDNAQMIARAIAAAITADAPPTMIPHLANVTVNLEGVTSVTQTSPAGAPALLLTGDAPGTVAMDAVPVPIFADMTAQDVAEAIATAMDNYYIVTVGAGVDDPAIFSTAKVDRDALYIMAPQTSLGFTTFSVIDPGPLTYSAFLPGDILLAGSTGNGARNNVFEGVILDDFILGSGERGEVVSNVAAANDLIPPVLKKPVGQVLEGAYQVEIRRGIDYGYPLFDVEDDGTILFGQQLTRGWDSNDRFADSTVLNMPLPSAIGPGSTLTISDGATTVVFEYDLTGSGAVAPGHVPINISTANTAIDVARLTGQAINAQQPLTSVATFSSGINALGQQFGSPNVELINVARATTTLSPVQINNIVGTTIDLSLLDPALIPEGTTVAINDGKRRILFEFDRDFISDLPTRGGALITERVDISAATTAEEVAAALVQTINSFSIQNVPGGTTPGTLLFPIPTAVTAEQTPGTANVQLRNAVDFAVTVPGGLSTTIVNAKFGDTNPVRDQGQIIIRGNTISNSEGFGIRYDAAARDANGSLPHPGAVQNLNAFNTARLVRGASISNNVISGNAGGGILISGDPGTDPLAPIPVVRAYNNTIYGGTVPVGVGIRVEQNSSPTLLNNVVASLATGVEVDATSSTTVLGATVFHRNKTNTIGINTGTFPITTGSGEELFVDPANGNFYPIAGSRVIDSSVETLQERPGLANVMTAIGYATSPLLAPERDQLGQLRVNDPAVPSPPGQGSNVFKDRGAVERADFSGPTAALIHPVTGNPLDPSITTLPVLQTGAVLDFPVQLIDGVQPADPQFGSGIDDRSVANDRLVVSGMDTIISRVKLIRDGVTLVEGLDYVFTYDSTNNVIHLRPTAGVWTPNHVYKIQLDNSPVITRRLDNTPITGIRDLAGNPLKANNLQGTTEFTITIDPVDFGDAPLPYPTLFNDNGAHHRIVTGLHLGATVTAETNGQPSPNALTDTGDDGVVLPANFVVSESRQITVTASAAGRLDAWIDFNRDGDWNDAGEQIFTNRALAAGANTLTVTVPSTAAFGESYARFRFSSAGGLAPTGPANDGEVEDYRIVIDPLASYTLQLNYSNGKELYRDLLNRYFVSPGLDIIAEVYVKDNRSVGAAGIRQAFADLVYDNDLIDFDPASLEFGPTFTSGRAGTVDEPNKTVDEAGGAATVAPQNADRQLLFRVRGTVKTGALAEQTLTLSLNQADVSPAHDTLLFNSTQPVLASYESEPIVVKANPWQNAANPLDVNANGITTGLDALIIINRLNLQGPAVLPTKPGESIPTDNPPTPLYPQPFYDVNGDGKITALDVLRIFNALNAGQTGALLAAGEAGTGSAVAAAPPEVSARTSVPLASSFDITPLAISVAGSGSTAAAPALAAAAIRTQAVRTTVRSAVADLFAVDDEDDASIPAATAALSPDTHNEVLASNDAWRETSMDFRRVRSSAAGGDLSQTESTFEAIGLDAATKKKKFMFSTR